MTTPVSRPRTVGSGPRRPPGMGRSVVEYPVVGVAGGQVELPHRPGRQLFSHLLEASKGCLSSFLSTVPQCRAWAPVSRPWNSGVGLWSDGGPTLSLRWLQNRKGGPPSVEGRPWGRARVGTCRTTDDYGSGRGAGTTTTVTTSASPHVQDTSLPSPHRQGPGLYVGTHVLGGGDCPGRDGGGWTRRVWVGVCGESRSSYNSPNCRDLSRLSPFHSTLRRDKDGTLETVLGTSGVL